jgi:L,D-transpeptidase ErfK/SrfK
VKTLLRALATSAGLALACAGPAPAGDGDNAGARSDVIGSVEHYRIVGDETLLQVARQYGLGFVEFMAANPGVDPWLPGIGTDVVVPDMHVLPDAPRRGIVINLTEMRLYLFSARGDVVGTWPIGIGQQGGMTPLGTTLVVRKELNPTWIPPASIREEKPELPAAVPPGPDNPLGDRALYLGWPRFLIHGTNKPWGVGRRVSHGCIRLYPEHIVELYRRVPVGTPVTVVDQPVKLGWRGGALYLQIHPSATQADQIEADGRFDPEPLPDLRDRVLAAAGDRATDVDWPAVDRAAAERSGIPVVVLGPGAEPSAEVSTRSAPTTAAAGAEAASGRPTHGRAARVGTCATGLRGTG